MARCAGCSSPSSPFYVRPRLDPSFLRWLLEFRGHCNARDYAAGLDALAELNRRTLPLYDELRAAGLSFEEHRTGLVMAYGKRRDAEHEIAASGWMDRFGFPQPVPGEPRELEPALNESVEGAFLLPVDRHIDPLSVVRAVVGSLADGGATIRTNAAVHAVRPNGTGADVVTADGTIQADVAIVAAGAWTPTLVRETHVRVPIIGGKGYALDFEPAPVRLGRALYLHDNRVAGTPYDGRLRLSGTMELTGLDTSVSRRRTQAIARAAARALRDWPDDARPARLSAGLRPLTPDGLPVVGRLGRNGGVWVASGHSMLGMTLGPSTGEALAATIAGRPAEVLRPFDPNRFSRG